MKTTTICVTGGTGFVGTGVVLALLQAGFQVRALVRNENSAKKLDIIPEEFRSSLSCIFGDPCHSDDIARALEGCSALVHLVGIRRHEIKKTGKTYRDIDVGSAIAATDAMKRTGVKRIVLLSAGAIGKSEYVRCKAEAEKAIVTAGLDWTIFRPAFII